jgi:hypothetical protein
VIAPNIRTNGDECPDIAFEVRACQPESTHGRPEDPPTVFGHRRAGARARDIRSEATPVRIEIRHIGFGTKPIRLDERAIAIEVTPIRLEEITIAIEATPIASEATPTRFETTTIAI